MDSLRRRSTAGIAVVLAVTALAACSSSDGVHLRVSSSSSSSGGPITVLFPEGIASEGFVGSPLTISSGRGQTSVTVPVPIPDAGYGVAVNCTGHGPFVISNTAGLHLMAAQCEGTAVLDLYPGEADDGVVKLAVDPGVTWTIGVWRRK